MSSLSATPPFTHLLSVVGLRSPTHPLSSHSRISRPRAPFTAHSNSTSSHLPPGIPHPASCILHPASRVLHHASCCCNPASRKS
ncbi:hypothetical protein SCP_0604230 [Sparassis crispa]|uniref:Uncharacterized protein n=1 Tax=Sparassis crispa TaxID=139825 RepID=A0A401GRU1_9APHY|nr:hypothetical protein SCP_0604230 [Sparassis crispa]GBE84444.1 hypothetical protein SCP_0604230 [Sparassis crispa]